MLFHLKNRIKFLSFSLFLLLSFTGVAQKIKVQNSESKKGISEVFIYNKNKSATAISDSSGVIDISNFSKRDTLIFTHQSYATFMIPKLNIGNVIYLTQQTFNIPAFKIVNILFLQGYNSIYTFWL